MGSWSYLAGFFVNDCIEDEFDFVLIFDLDLDVSDFLVVLFEVHGPLEVRNIVFFLEVPLEVEVFPFTVVVQSDVLLEGVFFVEDTVGEVVHAFQPFSVFVVLFLFVGEVFEEVYFSEGYRG